MKATQREICNLLGCHPTKKSEKSRWVGRLCTSVLGFDACETGEKTIDIDIIKEAINIYAIGILSNVGYERSIPVTFEKFKEDLINIRLLKRLK